MRRLLPRIVAAGLLGGLLGSLLGGCTIEAMPISVSPREMVLPYLEKECLRAAPKPNDAVLVSAGTAPRRRLRFSHHDVTAQIQVLEPPFQEAAYVVDTEWLEVGIRGQGCHEFEVSGPKTSHIGDPVVGVAGVTVDGASSFSTDALDDKSFVVERDLYWALDRADPILPHEAVGEGAVWRVQAEGTRGGERLEIDATYTLRSIQGSHVVLEVARTIDRPAQRLRGPRGYSRRVEAEQRDEIGTIDFDLRDRPFPSARFFDDHGREVLRVMTAYR